MVAKAHIANHPIHPMLVPFPIGLWIFSFIADIVLLGGGDAVWAAVARYTMAGGIIGAIAAAVPGAIDLFSMRSSEIRGIGLQHMILNLSALVLFIANFFLRATVPPQTLTPFMLSLVGVGILIVSGWLGGEMVYVHGAAVEPAKLQDHQDSFKKAA